MILNFHCGCRLLIGQRCHANGFKVTWLHCFFHIPPGGGVGYLSDCPIGNGVDSPPADQT